MSGQPVEDPTELLTKLSEVELPSEAVERAMRRTRTALSGASAPWKLAKGKAERARSRSAIRLALSTVLVLVVLILFGVVKVGDTGALNAFAEVQSAVAHMRWIACSVEVVQVASGYDAKAGRVVIDVKGNRMRFESADRKEILVFDVDRNRLLQLLPQQKIAVLFRAERPEERFSYQEFFRRLQTANFDGVEQLKDGQESGHPVKRFRIAASERFPGGAELIVAADLQTHLPVRIDLFSRDTRGQLLLHMIYKDFRFDSQDPKLFDLVAPPGYRLQRIEPESPAVEVEVPARSTEGVAIEFRLAESAPHDGWAEATIRKTQTKVHLSPKPIIVNRDIETARLLERRQGNAIVATRIIEFTFTPDGAARLAAATSQNHGKRLAILVDGKVVCAPRILSEISKTAQWTGDFSRDEASAIVRTFVSSGTKKK